MIPFVQLLSPISDEIVGYPAWLPENRYICVERVFDTRDIFRALVSGDIKMCAVFTFSPLDAVESKSPSLGSENF